MDSSEETFERITTIVSCLRHRLSHVSVLRMRDAEMQLSESEACSFQDAAGRQTVADHGRRSLQPGEA